jgi:hypothetical protein
VAGIDVNDDFLSLQLKSRDSLSLSLSNQGLKNKKNKVLD